MRLSMRSPMSWRDVSPHPKTSKLKDLALFDIEFLFLKTRAKSVGEVITVEVADPEDRRSQGGYRNQH